MNEEILKELKEIKKLLQVIASNSERESDISTFKFWFGYWKDYTPIFILGFVAGCTLYPLVKDLWIWLIT